MHTTLTSITGWAKRNERHLSSLFFLGGFVGDIIAFILLEVSIVNLIFAVYLGLGAAAILISHYLFSHQKENQNRFLSILSFVLPLFVQYAIGSILSGSLIFYTKSASLFVSWPFLLLLAVVFFGNEVFRSYREHLAFQTTLFFFGFYAYAIFALPLILGTLGPAVFLQSSLVAVVAFAVFLAALYFVGQKRVSSSFRAVIAGSAAIVLAINALYFTSLIPPLPLGIKDIGVYHSIVRTSEGYNLLREGKQMWWEGYKPTIVHHVPGTSLFVYSAVFAPIRFSAGVVHEWERYDEDKQKWLVMSRVPFSVSGGRAEGYRGYSEKGNPEAGKWRVSVKTTEGQTIGRISFTIVAVPMLPPLVEETR